MVGHIVYGDGLAIDLDCVKASEALSLTSNKNIVQSFIEQVNFVRKFVNDFSKIISSITIMLKKDAHLS